MVNATLETFQAFLELTLTLLKENLGSNSVFVLGKLTTGTPAAPAFKVVSASSDTESSADIGSEVSGGPLHSWVLSSGKPLTFLVSERGASHVQGLYDRDALPDSVAIIPVSIGARVCALIWVDRRDNLQFSTDQLTYMCSFAKTISSLLESNGGEEFFSRLLYPQDLATADQTALLSADDFFLTVESIVRSKGSKTAELVRFSIKNCELVEESIGVGATVKLYDLSIKRILQIFPRGTPILKLPDGGILALVDAMLVGLYSNRIKAICELTRGENGKHLEFDTFRAGLRKSCESGTSIGDVINQFNSSRVAAREALFSK